MINGGVIKEIRKKSGQSQFELAQACELSQTYLSQIENGKKTPNLSTLEAICKQLSVPLPVLTLLSIEREDIPANKRELYDRLYPTIKTMLSELFD